MKGWIGAGFESEREMGDENPYDSPEEKPRSSVGDFALWRVRKFALWGTAGGVVIAVAIFIGGTIHLRITQGPLPPGTVRCGMEALFWQGVLLVGVPLGAAIGFLAGMIVAEARNVWCERQFLRREKSGATGTGLSDDA